MTKAQWVGNIFMRGEEILGRIEFDDVNGWIGSVDDDIIGAWDYAHAARHAIRNEIDARRLGA
jgi:hypothetical protein